MMNLDLSGVKQTSNIPLTARDRQFFTQLTHFMNDELTKVGNHPSKERFAIFRLVFEKAIDTSSLYRPLFRAIKHEYERCITALESGAEEVQSMSAELHRMVLEPKTFLLRQKRCMDLEDKLSIIERENALIKLEIDQVLNETISEESKSSTSIDSVAVVDEQPPSTGHRRVPGLSFDEETNLKSLGAYYDFLRKKWAQLNENASSKYTTKEKRVEIQQLFENKLAELDRAREQRLMLRNRLRLYHLAWRTTKQYVAEDETSTGGNDRLLEEAILNVIYESSSGFHKNEQETEEDFDSASLYDKEAGSVLNHIEIFMELMERGNYKEASYVAACSPKGVLRNMETLLKFKEMEKPLEEEISPWLFHCKVLAETALEASFKPDLLISLECTKAACHANHLNLLYKWIVEDRLTCSFEMAQLIERAGALDLAEFIYRRVGAHYEVASCLLQADSSKRCLDYLVSVADTIPSMNEFLIKLFNQYPSVKFAIDIMHHLPTRYLQADELVLLFLQLDQHLNAIEFLEQLLQEKGTKNYDQQEADKLQKCFDLLKKYSYLVDDEEAPSTANNDADGVEREIAHRLTRRITRSALDRFRRMRRRSSTASITLEPIQEQPTPTPPPLCHRDFFNDFPDGLYFTDDVQLRTEDVRESPAHERE